MSSSKQWWRRASAAAKDKWTICLTMAVGGRHFLRRGPDVEVAVIRATSHSERSVDYKSAGRIFAWARTAPSPLLTPMIWAVGRRASRTRSWPVALKCLLLAHGLLLCSDDAPPSARVGRVPFDLSDFRGRSSTSPGFSAFIRAYFRFLDRRSQFSSLNDSVSPSPSPAPGSADGLDDVDLDRLEQLQILLDLLMQIRPYGDGMEVGLVLDAMDCVVIETFEVYSGICRGIAQFLASALGPDPARPEAVTDAMKRRQKTGIRILRRAVAQSAQLTAYFDLCRGLRLLNAAELPPVQGIPEKDMEDIEKLMLGGTAGSIEAGSTADDEGKTKKTPAKCGSGTLVSTDWVGFEDEDHFKKKPNLSTDQFGLPSKWALMVDHDPAREPFPHGDLIDLS